MSESPPALSALRARYRDRDPTPEERAALAADPRKGAAQLLKTLDNRAAAAARWSRRVAELNRHRERLAADGFTAVGGVDEAGRGPLAGPVFTACVVLPADWDLPGLDDSKRLSRSRREALEVEIKRQARGFAVDLASPEEIDEVNILRATMASMRRAVAACGPVRPDYVLTDAVALKETGLPFRPVIGGDRKVAEIAAASVLAKTARDAMMRDADRRYPGYGFADHKGYGTAAHLDALARLGPCEIHRRSFAPVAKWVLPDARELARRMRHCRDLDQLREVGEAVRRAGRRLTEDELTRLRRLYKALLRDLRR